MQRDLLGRSVPEPEQRRPGAGEIHTSRPRLLREVGISPPLRNAVTFIRSRCSVRPGGATNP